MPLPLTPGSRTRVGAYPGTFDPPTIAHVAIAEAAVRQCQLDAVDLVVNASPLAKATTRSLAIRVAMLEAVAATRPWLRVVITEQQLIADIVEGYDVLVLGADKWTQVIDAAFYESETARDSAVARLPPLAIVARHGHALPASGVVLTIDTALAKVSSTAARAGDVDVVPVEVRPFL